MAPILKSNSVINCHKKRQPENVQNGFVKKFGSNPIHLQRLWVDFCKQIMKIHVLMRHSMSLRPRSWDQTVEIAYTQWCNVHPHPMLKNILKYSMSNGIIAKSLQMLQIKYWNTQKRFTRRTLLISFTSSHYITFSMSFWKIYPKMYYLMRLLVSRVV